MGSSENLMRKKRANLTEEQQEIADDLDQKSALEIVAKSEGGQLLMRGYLSDMVGTIDTLTIQYQKLSHMELIGLIASMKSSLDSYRVLSQAPKNRLELQKILELALKPPEGS